MNAVFPPSTDGSAESLPNSRLILHTHVTSRTLLATTAFASIFSLTRTITSRKWPLITGLIRSNATATLIAIPLGIAMTEFKMQGKEEIEWQDRSYRLLNNAGQNELDVLGWGGFGAGLVGGLLMRKGVMRTVGMAGLGGVFGLVGFGVKRNWESIEKGISKVKEEIEKMTNKKSE
ncbi:hypothetical protein HDU97_007726 [Phlyctochytrium planicorne]|nr:hypothetical protein HDU97_007726 [Phlyctochytrium planicorne]